MFFSRLSAALIGGGLTAITFNCAFIRRSRKGLLFLHYATLFSIHGWTGEAELVGTSLMSTLVGSAVFLVLAEHAFTLETKEVPLDTPKEIVHVLGACAYLDAAAAILHYNAFGLDRLMYLTSMLACTGYLLINPRKGSFEVPIEQLVEIGEETFFYDLARPLNALGRRGWFQLLFVSSRMLIGLMPYLSNKLLVRDLFVLGQCTSAWFLLTSPLMIGGLVHSMKQTVRAVVERRMKERIDEVEQEEKQKGGRRSKEQIEAEVVHEFTDDETLGTELL